MELRGTKVEVKLKKADPLSWATLNLREEGKKEETPKDDA